MKEGRLTAASVLAAIMASICCIGPLVAAGLGLGAFAAAGIFEQLRPYLLAVTVALLGAAFYLTYRPAAREDCSGPACPPRSSSRSNKLVLWIAAGLVAAFAAFPYYSGVFWKDAGARAAARDRKPAVAAATLSSLTLEIDGMTCGGCAATVQSSLSSIQGIEEASVSFERKDAAVRFDASRVTAAELVKAVENAGYKARVKS